MKQKHRLLSDDALLLVVLLVLGLIQLGLATTPGMGLMWSIFSAALAAAAMLAFCYRVFFQRP